MTVRFKPEGYHTVTPYLLTEDADNLLDFIEMALGGTNTERMRDKEGRTLHGAIKVGDSMVMVGAKKDHPPTSVMLYLYVEDTDALYHQAIKAGATSVLAPMDQFYGDRSAAVMDPFGNQWWMATHIEDVSDEEIRKRAQAMGKV